MHAQHSAPIAGRYQLEERLAGGGMGEVWKARDLNLERTVAIKVVDLSQPDATLSERFRREAVATSRLTSPNVVQVFDAGTDGTTAFLVMELLSGPSLHQLVHEHGALPMDQGLTVAHEVARGLMAAHAIGVVHRDIKPGNVMFDGNRIKLVDFGIAQLSEKMGATLTAPATALGTAAYMSPEQATGSGATQASDWYAFGCLLTTVFTGDPPFKGDAVHVATQQVDGRPPRLSQRRADVPPALDDLVAALLAKDPRDRPTGQAVVDQITALQVDPNAATTVLPAAGGAATALLPARPADVTPVMSAPAPPRPADLDQGEDRRRSPWPWIVVAALLLAALAAGAWWLLAPNEPTEPVASATPTAAPRTSSAPRTSTVPPAPATSTRPPASVKTTQAPTTRSSAPRSSAPVSSVPASGRAATTPSRTPGSGEDSAAVVAAINAVGDRGAQRQLEKAWEKDQKDPAGEFGQTIFDLQAGGKLTDQEASDLKRAAGLGD